MGTISSGVGLISGLDIQSLVKQLIAIEARPLEQLKERISTTRDRQTAYTTLAAQLTALQGAATALSVTSTFNARTATSSAPDVLAATVGASTPIGNYTFTVRSLVSTHQLVSQGFRDSSTTPIGAGTLTFENAAARVAPDTSLNGLNDGAGVRRGIIRITDQRGSTVDVDLAGATTVGDVLKAINNQSQASVLASVSGGAIVLTDTSGGTTTQLSVVDVGAGKAAADLGLAQTATTSQIRGKDLVSLNGNSLLSRLNDNLGVRFDRYNSDFLVRLGNGGEYTVDLTDTMSFDTHLGQLNDGRGVRLGTIRITNGLGQSATVDLSGAATVQDVRTAIDGANIGVNFSAISSNKLILHDTTGGRISPLKIEDVSGYAAADLGIATQAASGTDTITGAVVYRMDTLNSVVKAIEFAKDANGVLNDGRLTATVTGKYLTLTDLKGGTGTAEVVALNGSRAAVDLGIEGVFGSDGQLQGRQLVGGLNTVLLSTLRGGAGLATGPITFTRSDGSTIADLDFSAAATLNDVVDIINQDGRLGARVDDGGARLLITDPTAGTGTFGATGAFTDALGLSTAGAGQLSSSDLQRRYISENTLLASLNGGKGIAYGRFTITAADGSVRAISLTSSLHKTVGDVIDEINNQGMGVAARINANGDGIELQDTTGGAGRLNITESGTGTTAAALGIVGSADDAGILTGSFARRIQISATDTLDGVVAKINASGADVIATVINDGTGDNPYRLVITSRNSGTAGQMIFSADLPSLALNTLTEAQDAKVIVGQPGSPAAIVVSGSSNTISDVVPGLKLNLAATSNTPVQVSVAQDTDSVVNNVKTFVTTFNQVMDSIGKLTQFIPETNTSGKLKGDSTVQQITNRLFNMIDSTVNSAGLTLTRLRDVGIMIDSGGGSALRLTMSRTLGAGKAGEMTIDGEAQLRRALADDPDAVRKLFTLTSTDKDGKVVNIGFATRFRAELQALAGSGSSLIADQNAALQAKIDQYTERATNMQKLLDIRQAQLTAQFQAMEQALASLQSQQTALSSLASLASSLGS